MSSRGNQCEMVEILELKIEKMEAELMVAQSTTGNLLTESSKKPTALLDLNDDCVREILKFLNASDLCSIAEACTTKNSTSFKEIASDVFKGSRKIFNFEDESVTSIAETRRIFFNFVKFISQLQINFTYLRIDAPYKNEDLLDVVVEFCSKTLKSLTIEQYEIPEKQLVTLRPLLKNLNKLHLINVRIQGIEENLFANCDSLVELVVEYSDDNLQICESVFPKLEKFTYSTPDYLNLEDFFARHKNLETIAIRSMDPWTSYMYLIAANCKHLKELDIRVTDAHENPNEYEKAVESVLTLKHLNELTIDCDYKNVTKFLQVLKSLKSLECLSLHFADCSSEFMAEIGQLHQLCKLELFRWLKLGNINQLGNLTRLTDLSVTQWSSENIEFDILQLVKRLINLRKFMFI